MKRGVVMILAVLICVGTWVGLALILTITSTWVSGFAKKVVDGLGVCLLVILFWALLWNVEGLYEWFLETSGYYE